VPAGHAGTGTINVNGINGYGGTVTLSCSSVSPVAVSPPVCAFNPAAVTVPGTTSATLTIQTIGPTTPTTTRAGGVRVFYALLLPLPMLGLLGAAAGGKRLRVWGVLALLVMSALVLLMPACSTTSTPATVNNSTVITPAGTYTFTVTGVDEKGASASNISGGTTSSVTLSVTKATTN
jgi:hypothetical protein